jgi:hypothetical protein
MTSRYRRTNWTLWKIRYELSEYAWRWRVRLDRRGLPNRGLVSALVGDMSVYDRLTTGTRGNRPVAGE